MGSPTVRVNGVDVDPLAFTDVYDYVAGNRHLTYAIITDPEGHRLSIVHGDHLPDAAGSP